MISFVIPTLNEEKILAKTLGMFAELRIPHEIIVSDGKSTDRTIEIAEKHNAKTIVYAGDTRQTIANGRNLGASIASGEFLVFLDADVSVPNITLFFAKLLEKFAYNKKLVGVTVGQRAIPEVETVADRFFFRMINYTFFVMNNIFGFGAAPGEFQMMRTSTFREIGGFNDLLVAGEDSELFQRLSKVGNTRIELSLYVMHPVRRAHKVGWLKLISVWWMNRFSATFLKRSYNEVWKEVR